MKKAKPAVYLSSLARLLVETAQYVFMVISIEALVVVVVVADFVCSTVVWMKI